MRGEIYEINGHSFFCFGGARSTERGIATGTEKYDKGKSWWPEEVPSAQEMYWAKENLAAHGNKVDFVITHDMPAGVNTVRRRRISSVSNFLEEIRNSIEYFHWFCGHMHWDMEYVGQRVSLLYNRPPMDIEDIPVIDNTTSMFNWWHGKERL